MGEGVVVSEAQHALTFIKSKWRRRNYTVEPYAAGRFSRLCSSNRSRIEDDVRMSQEAAMTSHSSRQGVPISRARDSLVPTGKQIC